MKRASLMGTSLLFALAYMTPVFAFAAPVVEVTNVSWIKGYASSSVSYTVTVTPVEGVTVTCLFDSGDPATSYTVADSCMGAMTASLADGTYSFSVVAKDGDGVETATVPETVIMDTVAPEFTSDPPVLEAKATQKVEDTLFAPIVFNLPTATDAHETVVTCEKHSGDIFYDGEVMQCYATDAAGNVSTISIFGLQATVTDLSDEEAQASTPKLSDNTKAAVADGSYENGFDWTYTFTLPLTETDFTMSFSDLKSGTDTITADNVRMWSEQADNFKDASTAYAFKGADKESDAMKLTGDSDAAMAGRQIVIHVQVRIPKDAIGGTYTGTYSAASKKPDSGGGGPVGPV